MPDSISDILNFFGWFYGAPGYAVAFTSSIIWGYILRGIKRIANENIPLLVTLWGAGANIALADPYSPPASLRIWVWKNLIIGLIIGYVAVRFHRVVLKRLEDKIPFFKGVVTDSETERFKSGQPGWDVQIKQDPDPTKRIQNPPQLPCEPGGGSLGGSPITPKGP